MVMLSERMESRLQSMIAKSGYLNRQVFERLLDESVKRHGHLCAGQVIGVRMAMLGCHLVGIDHPREPQNRKKMMVYLEIDRCASDAIESVTGCRLGKRTLKFRDFGINAATFLNLETDAAFRIVSTENSRQLAKEYAPDETTPQGQQLEGYKVMPDEQLFQVQQVKVHLEAWEMPGPPRRRIECDRCGQVVRDGREKKVGTKTLCRICVGESYFTPMENVP